MNVLAFDIETIPDVETGRRLHDLAGLSDGDVARALAMKRREQTGDSEFLPRYWETGGEDQSFRYNNYLNRFHERHTDLMDVLSNYQARAAAPLDEVAVLLGFPGKMGKSGSHVWEQYQAERIDDIRNYCETDALNTYLIYLRYELIRGSLDEAGWAREIDLVRSTLRGANKSHLNEFLSAWNEPPV